VVNQATRIHDLGYDEDRS